MVEEKLVEATPPPAGREYIPPASTLLFVAAQLIKGEGDKNYKADPELGRAIEEVGIGKIDLQMFFGPHELTNNLYRQLQEFDVVTGEIKQNTNLGGLERDNGGRVIEESDFIVFLRNLQKTTGVEGFSNEYFEGVKNLEKLFDENKAIFTTEGNSGSRSPYGNISPEASRKYASMKGKVIWGLMLVAFAADAGLANKLLGVKMTRRQFLKGFGLVLGTAALLPLFMKITDASSKTLIDQQYVEGPGGKQVSRFFGKLERFSDDVGEEFLRLTEDPIIARGFQRLHRMRNQAMALNTWFLTHLIDRHSGLRGILQEDRDKVKIGFWAGGGHRAAKAEFCKGSKQLELEVKEATGLFVKEYLKDVAQNIDKPEILANYYADLFGSLASPQLFKKIGLPFEALEKRGKKSIVETPAAILYKSLLAKIKTEKGISQKRALNSLFEAILYQQLDLDVSEKEIYQVAGLGVNSYRPRDDETLLRRMIASGVVPKNVSKSNCSVEIYQNIATLKYQREGDTREVGLVIVDGAPFPFFDKESLSFLS